MSSLRLTLLFLLFAIGTMPGRLHGQYVSIPDTAFASWLRSNIPAAMSGNMLDTGHNDLTSIQELDVSNRDIESLEGLRYFDNLNKLVCRRNRIRSLPELPPYLRDIYCEDNLIDSITFLRPHGRLFCARNRIKKIWLPTTGYWELRCQNNLLTSLPALPYNLQTLDADSNLLESLPPLPDMMTWLRVRHNKITRMPVFNRKIQYLDVSYNLLDSIPVLPDEVRSLTCVGNKIRHMANIPRWMYTLNCSDNLLEELPEHWPNGFLWLECERNRLKRLPDIPSLYSLKCRSNLLTELPELPPNFDHLDCADNRITCFRVFRDRVWYIDISGNPFTCLPNHTASMDSLTRTYPLCREGDTLNNPGGCEEGIGISGHVFFDYNANCAYNPGEGIPYVAVSLLDSNRRFIATVYSGADGSYQITRTKGTYFLRTDTLNIPFSLCSGVSEWKAVITPQQAAIQDMGFLCKPAADQGIRAVLARGMVFPGQVHELITLAGDMSSTYGLRCFEGNAGTVEITFEGKVKYAGPLPGALQPVHSGNTLTYTLADLSYLQPGSLTVYMTVDTLATANDSVCVLVKITPSMSDANPENNIRRFCYRIFNSYDPNMKEVYPSSVAPGYDDRFIYTVHFQNTGNAKAIKVRIADTLDPLLDAESFRVEAHSHPMKTVMYGRNVQFVFSDIQLPDSNSDPAGSKGWVQFSIRPRAALSTGVMIRNTAFIYFDYNSPVITNTALISCAEPSSGMPDLAMKKRVNVYPNPSGGSIRYRYDGDFTLLVTDLTGTVLMKTTGPGEVTLPPGVYFFRFQTGDLVCTEKVVVLEQ